MNKDLQSNEIGTNQQLLEEEGRSERVCSSLIDIKRACVNLLSINLALSIN